MAGANPAKATFAFYGKSVALVSDKALNRGPANVFIDGIKVGSINGLSTTKFNMVIMFSQTWASNGTHVLQVVTTSTKRVDIDVFVVGA